MEKGTFRAHKSRDYFLFFWYEFMGTTLLSMAYNFSFVGNSALEAGIGVGFAYIAAYVFASAVSGAYCNPAVTIGVFIHKYNSDYVGYQLVICFILLLAQFSGAFFGGIVSYIGLAGNVAVLAPSDPMN